MWLIRGIVGLIFLGMAVATVPMWFTSPYSVVFTMVFASLGLWIIGWVTRFSTAKAKEENARREIEIRQSKVFGLRNRAMGLIALLFGGLGIYIEYDSNWQAGGKALIGSVAFVCLGMWYLLKGAEAEGSIDTQTLDTSGHQNVDATSKFPPNSEESLAAYKAELESDPEYQKMYQQFERGARKMGERMEAEAMKELASNPSPQGETTGKPTASGGQRSRA
jgi:hypothetical protein